MYLIKFWFFFLPKNVSWAIFFNLIFMILYGSHSNLRKIIIMKKKSHVYLQYTCISKHLLNLLVLNCMRNWLHKAPTIFACPSYIINSLCSHISCWISDISTYSWNCLLIFSRLRISSTFWGNNWSLKYNISLIISVLTAIFLTDTNNTTSKQYNEDNQSYSQNAK